MNSTLENMDNSVLYRSINDYTTAKAYYDAALNRLKLCLPIEELNVKTSFGVTHIIAAGNLQAQPVVLLHGNGNNAAIWERQLPTLAQNYRVYALDIIGEGGKSAPTRLSPAITEYAQWLTEVLDALGIDKAHYIGHSKGGWLIIKLAEYAPQRIASASLLAPLGLIGFNYSKLLPVFFWSMLDIRRAAKKMFAPAAPIPDEIIEEFSLVSKAYKTAAPPQPFNKEQLENLTVPVMVLAGQFDRLFKAEKLVQQAKNSFSQLINAEIIQAGHYMLIDQADTINNYLTKFLANQLTIKH